MFCFKKFLQNILLFLRYLPSFDFVTLKKYEAKNYLFKIFFSVSSHNKVLKLYQTVGNYIRNVIVLKRFLRYLIVFEIFAMFWFCELEKIWSKNKF